MPREGEARPPEGGRGLREVMEEVAKSRKSIPASQGQIALRRRSITLSQLGLRLFKQTSEQVVWRDGCFSVSAEAKWDETRCGRDIVLTNHNTTVTRSNGNEWGGVLGSQLFTQGTHTFTYFINKCQTDYVYVGVAYDNVDYNDNYNARNIVLRAGDGSLRVFSSSQGCFGGYRTGDYIRIEVDMADKLVTFYKNDVRLCQASGINAPVRPFISIGSRDVVITIKSQDRKSLVEDAETAPRSPMLDLAVRTGLELVFAMLVKQDNALIRKRLLHSAHAALLSLPPLSFFLDSVGLKQEALLSISQFLQEISGSTGAADLSEEERSVTALVLLELAVARGSLSFTLSVLLHLEQHGIRLDARALSTIERLGQVDEIADPKVRGLFTDSDPAESAKDGAGAAGEGPAAAESAAGSDGPDDSLKDSEQGDRGGHASVQSLSFEGERESGSPLGDLRGTGGDGQRGGDCRGSERRLLDAAGVYAYAESELLGQGADSSRFAVLILYQLEAAARRLKGSLAVMAPSCIDASAATLRLLNALISAHTPSLASSSPKCDSYVILALLRLLSLNLRQIQRHPNLSEVPAELLSSLRTCLLDLVAVNEITSSWDPAALATVQEEAVSALRAGTPVLFSDPAQLAVLLEVMLPKQSQKAASSRTKTEENFLAMLLEYLAKPPVVWRVLQLHYPLQPLSGMKNPEGGRKAASETTEPSPISSLLSSSFSSRGTMPLQRDAYSASPGAAPWSSAGGQTQVQGSNGSDSGHGQGEGAAGGWRGGDGEDGLPSRARASAAGPADLFAASLLGVQSSPFASASAASAPGSGRAGAGKGDGAGLRMDGSELGAGSEEEKGVGNMFPCTRLLKCLLASVQHYLEYSSKSSAEEAGGGGGAVVAKGCWEVFKVAWRLAYVHWSQLNQASSADARTADEEAAVGAALSLSSEIACAILEHVQQVAELGIALMSKKTEAGLGGEKGTTRAEACKIMQLFQSAIGHVLPEVLAGVSAMPAAMTLVLPLSKVLRLLQDLATQMRCVVLDSRPPEDGDAQNSKEGEAAYVKFEIAAMEDGSMGLGRKGGGDAQDDEGESDGEGVEEVEGPGACDSIEGVVQALKLLSAQPVIKRVEVCSESWIPPTSMGMGGGGHGGGGGGQKSDAAYASAAAAGAAGAETAGHDGPVTQDAGEERHVVAIPGASYLLVEVCVCVCLCECFCARVCVCLRACARTCVYSHNPTQMRRYFVCCRSLSLTLI